MEEHNLTKLLNLLDNSNDEIILNQIMWVFGNITADSNKEIKLILLNNNFIEKLVVIYKNFNSQRIKINFIWIISNIVHTIHKDILENVKVNNTYKYNLAR